MVSTHCKWDAIKFSVSCCMKYHIKATPWFAARCIRIKGILIIPFVQSFSAFRWSSAGHKRLCRSQRSIAKKLYECTSNTASIPVSPQCRRSLEQLSALLLHYYRRLKCQHSICGIFAEYAVYGHFAVVLFGFPSLF